VDLDLRSSFSEIIWRLSRIRDRGHITPGHHPFFYQDIPKSREEYDKEFKMHPIEDFQAVFNQSKPARKQIFGIVWMPKDTLTFKGTSPPFYPLRSG
jgi:hypothetical protein